MPAAKISEEMYAKMIDDDFPEEEENIIDRNAFYMNPDYDEATIKERFYSIFGSHPPNEAFRLACEFATFVGYQAEVILKLSPEIINLMRSIDRDWVLRLHENDFRPHRSVLNEYERQQWREIENQIIREVFGSDESDEEANEPNPYDELYDIILAEDEEE